jgi:hypothetical protein
MALRVLAQHVRDDADRFLPSGDSFALKCRRRLLPHVAKRTPLATLRVPARTNGRRLMRLGRRTANCRTGFVSEFNRILLPPSVPELRRLLLPDGRRVASQDASYLLFIVEDLIRYSAVELAIEPESVFYDSIDLLPKPYRTRIARVDKHSVAREKTLAVLRPIAAELGVPHPLGVIHLAPDADTDALHALAELIGVPARMTQAVVSLRRAAERLIRKPKFKGTLYTATTSISAATSVPLPNSDIAEQLLAGTQYLPPLLSLGASTRRAHEAWKLAEPDFIPPSAPAFDDLRDAKPVKWASPDWDDED